ncbi:hypothetical protein ACHAXA_003619 [Cyclostephanos tholiformis]|uniref:Fe2OG dioxygenase domain-containing protein n=1 Tax=Cyclostephanos tholiformis TaxID=382380 RepID=A0ABD3SQB7_9STRA
MDDPILGNTWMKKSTSVDFVPSKSTNVESGNSANVRSVYVDVGIDGRVFGTGDLSRRMHDALMVVAGRRRGVGGDGIDGGDDVDDGLMDLYLLYAMDASAKEAVKAAMDGYGYVIDLEKDEDMQDEGSWGRIDGVMLLDRDDDDDDDDDDDGGGSSSSSSGTTSRTIYPSFAEAIARGNWKPGTGYSFVVREVPARRKAIDLGALLRALDPDGKLHAEARERGIILPGEEEEDGVNSLRGLLSDCERRVRSAPYEVARDESEAHRGGSSKGYDVISRRALLANSRDADGTENRKTLLHVMDSLANHGCLIVDLTDGDESTDDAYIMSEMWKTTSHFFDKVVDGEDGDAASRLPPMHIAEGVGSSTAMVGYASFKDGDNQFLETRLRRSDGALLPLETSSIIGEDGVRSMVDAFRIMSDVGRDVVRIATAASSVEAGAFLTEGSAVASSPRGVGGGSSPSIAGLSFEEKVISGIVDEGLGSEFSEEDAARRAKILASDAAILLTEEIMDDGRPLIVGRDIEHDEGPVSMSPLRICRYSNNNVDKFSRRKMTSEVFGAHTDTSFVTIIPAAKVSGLEVFDEDSLKWFRPELKARRHAKTLDPGGDMEARFPWHCRYLVIVPGELLQLTSRNNIPAAVHRVVATTDAPRLSAPVLLRCRPGTRMDVERYMGSPTRAGGLLLDSNGMRMEDIHDALQSKQDA